MNLSKKILELKKSDFKSTYGRFNLLTVLVIQIIPKLNDLKTNIRYFPLKSAIWAKISGDSTSQPHTMPAGQLHWDCQTHFQDSSFTGLANWSWMLTGNSARAVGCWPQFLSTWISPWATWTLSQYASWVLRVSSPRFRKLKLSVV